MPGPAAAAGRRSRWRSSATSGGSRIRSGGGVEGTPILDRASAGGARCAVPGRTDAGGRMTAQPDTGDRVAADLSTFHEQGYVVIEDALLPHQLDAVREGLEPFLRGAPM